MANANPQRNDFSGGKAADEEATPIDLAHLRRYTLGDRRLELEILALFATQVPLTLATLRRAQSDRDWSNAAHSLKGSARAVGAWQLAELAECAERLARVSERRACDRMLRRLEAAGAKACAHVASLGEHE